MRPVPRIRRRDERSREHPASLRAARHRERALPLVEPRPERMPAHHPERPSRRHAHNPRQILGITPFNHRHLNIAPRSAPRIALRSAPRHAPELPRLKPCAVHDRRGAVLDEVMAFAGMELRHVPVRLHALAAVEVREDERLAALHGEEVALAALYELYGAVPREIGMRAQYLVEPRDERHHVVRGAPVEVVLPMDVYLLRCVPLNAVRDPPRPLVGEERGDGHAEPRPGLAAFGEAVVVVRLGEMDERPQSARAVHGARQVPLERAAVVRLEYL